MEQFFQNRCTADPQEIGTLRDTASVKQRISFLENLCVELRTVADHYNKHTEASREALVAGDIREQKLQEKTDLLEKELIEKNKEIIAFTQKLEQAEAIQQKTEISFQALQKRMAYEREIARLDLEKERRIIKTINGKLSDTQTRLTYLEQAYKHLFEKLFQLYGSIDSGQTGQFDLAEFIASMRAENMALEELLTHSKTREEQLQEILETNISSISQLGIQPSDSSTGESSDGERTDTDGALVRRHGEYVQVIRDICTLADQRRAFHYIRELETGDDGSKQSAGAFLVDLLGRYAAPFIARAIQSAVSGRTRIPLLRLLDKCRNKHFFSAAAYWLDDPGYEVRIAAFEACCALSDEKSDDWHFSINKAIKDVHPAVRRRAALSLAVSKTIDPGPLCRHLLADTDAATRRLAVAAVAGTKDPETALGVLQRINDEEESVRSAATAAIGQILGIPAHGALALHPSKRRAFCSRLSAYILSSSDILFPKGTLIEAERIAAFIPETMLPEENKPIYTEQRQTLPAASVVQRNLDHGGMHKDNTKNNDSTDTEAGSGGSTVRKPPPPLVKNEAPRKTPPRDRPVVPDLPEIERVIRSSILGYPQHDLIKEFNTDPDALSCTIEKYIREGAIIRRGKKLFLP